MRIGILGDIHSNFEALSTVVRAMRSEGIDHWVQVGDVVGYGAGAERLHPPWIRELNCTVCIGNHDAAVVVNELDRPNTSTRTPAQADRVDPGTSFSTEELRLPAPATRWWSSIASTTPWSTAHCTCRSCSATS